MNHRLLLFAAALWACAAVAAGGAQPLDPPANHMPANDPGWHALVGATVHPTPAVTLSNAVVVIRGGRIESVRSGEAATVPAGARVWDYAGLHVYAGFIEPFVEVEAPRPDASQPGQHWNPNVTPARDVLDGPGLDKATREELRKLGFTAAALSPKQGVFRGWGAVVSLADVPEDRAEARPPIYRERAFQTIAFDGRGNPGSQMGEIALLRQTLLDVEWNATTTAPHPPSVLDEIVLDRGRPRGDPTPRTKFFFVTDDELEACRAIRILDEFAIRQAVIVGSGWEFRRLPALSAAFPFVLPLRFPKAPSLASVGEQAGADLRDLMAWEQAPTNPRRLAAAGFKFALTSAADRKEFHAHVRRAIQHGLREADALAALTLHAAELLGLEDQLGSMAPGKRAHLVVTDQPVFDEKAKLRDVWIDGLRYEITPVPPPSFVGQWRLETQPPLAPNVSATVEEKKLTLRVGEVSVQATKFFTDRRGISFAVDHRAFAPPGVVTFTGELEPGDTNLIRGHAVSAGGNLFIWTATRRASEGRKSDGPSPKSGPAESPEADTVKDIPERLGLPFGPYALFEPPAVETVLVRHATIWTCGPAGVLTNAALLVAGGKIRAVGADEEVAAQAQQWSEGGGWRVIDATGKHVTPGLIDCHSHTGISGGVNEMSQAVTAEVRVGDVTNPDDINWYRQLAGGLTTVNTLHGSANPIGGQNQVNKLRWGCVRPEDMHFDAAPAGIKFALGENVKRRADRYPNTRMGVEAVFLERFTAAREYAARWARFRRGEVPLPRRDLELDALAEVLAGERLVHCHSYRQDEILMFCRVAQDFGFKVGTFQHVLEGYKVAEVIREAALGASAFSDWWGYKAEAQDAIPYAGALLHAAGVLTSFNSDDSELARRLNLEAAKAVKYGALPPAEALQFVTLNPARQLRIDHRVGSLEPGKDADFVLWSGDPLSAFTRCEATWIEGRQYFSLEKDRLLRETIHQERQRIITKILRAKKKDSEGAKGAKDDAGQTPEAGPPPELARARAEGAGASSPEAREEAARMQANLELLRRGFDPAESLAGECGLREAHQF